MVLLPSRIPAIVHARLYKLSPITMLVWGSLLLLPAVLGQSHCPSSAFTVDCGSDSCTSGVWINGKQVNNGVTLVFSTTDPTGAQCGITFNWNGPAFTITDTHRNPVSGAFGATSGTFVWNPTQDGDYFYFDAHNNEFRGFISVVTDGAWSQWTCCGSNCNGGAQRTRTCSNPYPGGCVSDFITPSTRYCGSNCDSSVDGTCDTTSGQTCSNNWGPWSCVWGCWNAGLSCGSNTYNTRHCNGCANCPGCNGGSCPNDDTQAGPCTPSSGSACTNNWGAWGGCQKQDCVSGGIKYAQCPGGACLPGCSGPDPSTSCSLAPCTGTCGAYSTCPGSGIQGGPGNKNWCTCVPGACTETATCCNPQGCSGCANGCVRNVTTCDLNLFGWSPWDNCPCAVWRNGDPPQTYCQQNRTCNRPPAHDCDSFIGVEICAGPSSRPNISYACEPNFWSPWSPCSQPPCNRVGGGIQFRNCSDQLGYDTGGPTCQGPNIQQCNTQPCNCAITLCFALDGSASIPSSSWQKLINFTESFVYLINAGSGTKVGIVEFSDVWQTQVIQPVTGDLATILGALAYLGNNQLQGATDTGGGIDLCQDQLNQYGTVGLPKVILVITDGDPDVGPDAIIEAEKAKLNGTQIFVVGVAGDGGYNIQTLFNLASPPQYGYHLWNISDYGALQNIAQQLSADVCGSPGAAAASLLPLLALLAILPAGIGVFAITVRRRKKKPAPVPEPVEEEPPPPPVTRAAAPAPIVDKPKDWSVPGTRYIGFGQANIKVKWGTDAPPSAPRGHDKYDRWSMMAHPEGMKPGQKPTPSAMDMESGMGGGGEGEALGNGSGFARPKTCCERLFPCCFCCHPRALNQTVNKTASTPAPVPVTNTTAAQSSVNMNKMGPPSPRSAAPLPPRPAAGVGSASSSSPRSGGPTSSPRAGSPPKPPSPRPPKNGNRTADDDDADGNWQSNPAANYR